MLGQLDPVLAPPVDWAGLLPLLFLVGGAVVWLMVRSIVKNVPAGIDAAWTVGVAAVSIVAVVPLWIRVRDEGAIAAVGDQVGVDGFSLFMTVVIAVSVGLTALVFDGYLDREGLGGPEMYVLMLVSAAGGVTMASANDLVVMFLGLETLSIAVYVMVALQVRRVRSIEAGLKYFVLGAFSSAFLLYGIAMIYGSTGSTNLIEIRDYLDSVILLEDSMLLVGMAMLLVGLGFKVAAVPFHTWTPDVYQGAPTPVVAYMASAVKAAGFAALIRVVVVALEVRSDDWKPAVYAMAVATLAVGALVAIVQRDAKRMLAYSSISHAGFILVGVQAASDRGVAAALFYIATYSVLVVGSFAVLTIVSGAGDMRTSLNDLDGLARRRPVLALVFTVLLLAQAGVPMTSGFIAKFQVLGAAIDARSFWLAVTAMVAAVVSAFVYLRIMLSMYLGTDAAGDERDVAVTPTAAAALLLAVVFTVAAGLPGLSGVLDDLARDAVPQLVVVGG